MPGPQDIGELIGHYRNCLYFMRPFFQNEGWAHNSAVECCLCKAEALGSNPSGSMSKKAEFHMMFNFNHGKHMHYSVKSRVGRI